MGRPKFAIVMWTKTRQSGCVDVEKDVPEMFKDFTVGTPIYVYWQEVRTSRRKSEDLHPACVIGTADSEQEAKENEEAALNSYNNQQKRNHEKSVALKKQKKETKVKLITSASNSDEKILQEKPIFEDIIPAVLTNESDVEMYDESSQEENFVDYEDGSAKNVMQEEPISVTDQSDNESLTSRANTDNKIEKCSTTNKENKFSMMAKRIETALTCIPQDSLDSSIFDDLQQVAAELRSESTKANEELEALSSFVQVKNGSIIINIGAAQRIHDFGGLDVEEAAEEVDNTSAVFKAATKNKHWFMDGEHKERISKTHRVFLSQSTIDDVLVMGEGSSTKLLKYMMKCFYTDQDLAAMSACGRGDYPGIPKRLREAIIAFVIQHAKDKRTSTKLVEWMNKKCSNFRNKKNGRSNESGTQSDRQPKKKQQSPVKRKTHKTQSSPQKQTPQKVSHKKLSPKKQSPKKQIPKKQSPKKQSPKKQYKQATKPTNDSVVLPNVSLSQRLQASNVQEECRMSRMYSVPPLPPNLAPGHFHQYPTGHGPSVNAPWYQSYSGYGHYLNAPPPPHYGLPKYVDYTENIAPPGTTE